MPASHPARTEFDTMFVDHAGAPPGTHRAAHAHVARADPGDAGEPAAAVPHRSRPGVPPRHTGRDAHAGVPPDRRARRRSRHQPRPPRRNDRGVHQGVLRRGLHEPPASELLPVHRTVGGVRHPPARRALARARRLRHGPSPTCCAPAASIPRSGAGSPSASASTGWPRSATPSRTCARCTPATSASRSSSEWSSRCNWLRDYVPLPDDIELLAGHAQRSRHRGQRRRPRRWRARCRHGSSRSHRAASRRRQGDPRLGRHGDGVEHHVWCGASNFAPGDVVPLATVGTAMPDGRTIGSRGILGIPSDGMLCSARELGLGSDHSGILVLPPDTPLGRALRRGHRARRRRRVRRRRHPQPPRRLRPRRCGARSGRQARVCRSAPPRPTLPAARRPRRRDRRDRRRRALRPVHVDGAVRDRRRPQRAVDGRPAVRRRAAADQQRRRRQQLRDARAQPAEPRLRPRHPRRRRDPGARRHGRRAAHHARRDDAHADGGRAADLRRPRRADRAGRDHGRRAHRDRRRRRPRWPSSSPGSSRSGSPPASTRTGLRSDASARWERGVDAYGIDTSIARFVELLGETCPDLVVHAGAVDARAESLPPESRSTSLRVSQANRIIGVDLTRDDVAGLLDPIGFTVTGRRPGGADRRLCRAGVRTRPPRSTSSRRSPATTATRTSRSACRCPRCTATSAPVQQRRRQVREVLLGLGISEVMPSPFLSDDDLRRAGLDGAVLRVTNPLVADEDVLRPSLRPGLLRAVAFNEAHRRPGVALFEIGHVYPPGPGELPDEREMLGVVLAGAEAPAAIAVWREIAVGARRRGTNRPAACSRRSPSDALGDARRRAGTTIGAVGEVAPAVLDAYEDRRAGGDPRARPVRRPRRRGQAGAAGRRRAGTRRATSTWRSCSTRRFLPRSWRRRSARAPAACSSASSCSTSTAAPASPTARAAWPTACACRRPTAR